MEIDIRTLLSHLNPECKRAMGSAAELCVKQTHFNVEVEHLLLALLDAGAPDWTLLLGHYGVDADAVRTQVQACLDGFKRGNSRTPAMSPHFVPLLREAWLTSSMLLGSGQIRSGTILPALLELDSLRGMLIETAPALLTMPRERLKAELAALLAGSSEDAGPAGAPAAAMPGTPGMAGAASHGMPGGAQHGTPALDQFTVDMTAQARAGRIDPVRGRNAEIRQIIDILLRRRQNNPILTGEAGVGKTAVVEGFALRVAEGSVPGVLADVRVCSLDLALLQAGAGVRGEYEQRLKSVIAEVRAAATPVILFIDEAHQLIGAACGGHHLGQQRPAQPFAALVAAHVDRVLDRIFIGGIAAERAIAGKAEQHTGVILEADHRIAAGALGGEPVLHGVQRARMIFVQGRRVGDGIVEDVQNGLRVAFFGTADEGDGDTLVDDGLRPIRIVERDKAGVVAQVRHLH